MDHLDQFLGESVVEEITTGPGKLTSKCTSNRKRNRCPAAQAERFQEHHRQNSMINDLKKEEMGFRDEQSIG